MRDKQRRFAGVGKPDQAGVGDDLELHRDPALLTGMAPLALPGARLVDDLKCVFPCPPPASSHDQFVAGRLQVPEHMAAVTIPDDRSRGYLDHQVAATAAEAVRALSVFPACRLPVTLVRKVGQVRMTQRGADDHAAAVPAVAAVGAAPRRVFFTPEAEAAIAPSPSLHEYRNPIDEHGALPMQADQLFAAAGPLPALTEPR